MPEEPKLARVSYTAIQGLARLVMAKDAILSCTRAQFKSCFEGWDTLEL